MRRFAQLVLVVFALMSVHAPASAGTEQFPNMSDECSGFVHAVDGDTRVRPRELDLCKGWFTTTTAGGAPALQVTLQVSAPPDGTVDGLYVSFWESGDCTYGVTVDGAVNAPHPQAFSSTCETGEVTCTVPVLELNCTVEDTAEYFPLPGGSVVWDDDRLQVTVPFTGELAQFAPAHTSGAVLTNARAFSALAVGPAHGWAAVCSSGLPTDRCVEANGDWMYGVRNYRTGT